MNPNLIIISGPNGSGKTSVTNKILEHQWIKGCEYINPDFIARDVFGDWNSPDAVLSAVKLATKKRETCLNEKRSLCFETVFSTPEKLDFIEKAKKLGYFIRLFFVCTDSPVINAGRIAQRVMQGGHDVPTTKVISRYSKSIANCCAATAMVDRLYVYDNSVDYEDAKLLFRATDGKLIKKYVTINDWAEEIFETVN